MAKQKTPRIRAVEVEGQGHGALEEPALNAGDEGCKRRENPQARRRT